MKPIIENLSVFTYTLGLACIENYLLYVLNINNYEYRHLYAKSFLPFFDIAVAFLKESASYAYFNKIERLVNVADKKGLIHFSAFNDLNEEIYRCDYCCLQINSEFIKERYRGQIWRDDHYYLLSAIDGDTWTCLNDNPRERIVFKYDELCNVYGGAGYCFTWVYVGNY